MLCEKNTHLRGSFFVISIFIIYHSIANKRLRAFSILSIVVFAFLRSETNTTRVCHKCVFSPVTIILDSSVDRLAQTMFRRAGQSLGIVIYRDWRHIDTDIQI